MTKLVTTADAGHVRTITLNRAEKKNALNLELAWGVIAAVEAAALDDNVWVVRSPARRRLLRRPGPGGSSPTRPTRRRPPCSTTSAGSASSC
jgi:hypothetical protein